MRRFFPLGFLHALQHRRLSGLLARLPQLGGRRENLVAADFRRLLQRLRTTSESVSSKIGWLRP